MSALERGCWSIRESDSTSSIAVIDGAGRNVARVPGREDDLDIARAIALLPELVAFIHSAEGPAARLLRRRLRGE